MNILNNAEDALKKARAAGSDKTTVTVTLKEEQEFTIDSNQLTLSRTGFDQSLKITSILGQSKGTSEGNQLDSESMAAYANNSVSQAKAAPSDAANDICEAQGTHHFADSVADLDEKRITGLLVDLLSQREQMFPAITIDNSMLKFIKTQKALITSDKTILTSEQSHLEGFLFFTAKSGAKSSSFNYVQITLPGKSPKEAESLLNFNGLQSILKDTTEQIDARKLPNKFEGDVIIAPSCMNDFFHELSWMLSGTAIYSKDSFLTDKLGTLIANPLWNVQAQALSADFATKKYWNADGYLAENESLLENGILKNYRLDSYFARKLNQKVDRSGTHNLNIAAGAIALQEMISKVKKGILLNRYSGETHASGNFAGVAKNSYYIENGEILFPLNETMVSGNLGEILKNTLAMSKETRSSGEWRSPWVHTTGVTVS